MAVGACIAGPVGCVLRHADANNEIIEYFDEKIVRTHIMAIDCNAQ
jgi:hypothetical protein